MVYNCKDQPTILRQDSKPGTTHHYRRNEVHTHGATTAIQPLQQRRQAKVILQAEKYKCLPDHPMKKKVEGRTKYRIKRSSFTHEVKKLQKDYPTVLTIPTLTLSKQDFTNPCENTTSEIQINTTIPQLDQGKELAASIRRGGAGIIIQYPRAATQTASWFCHREALYQL